MRVLGLIPVRGGSKGVLRKNEKLLLGKPLLQYTTESALKARGLTLAVVSTEDQSLYDLAQKLNISVPFKRPRHLSEDNSGSLEVVQHALTELKNQGEEFDAICLLQTTSPFRADGMIDAALTTFKEAKTDSLVSVIPVPHEYNPHWVFEPNKEGHLSIATGETEIIKRRQDLPPAYVRDGAIYITKTEVVLEKNSLFGNSTSYIVSDLNRHVNIDTVDDWKTAVKLAQKLFG